MRPQRSERVRDWWAESLAGCLQAVMQADPNAVARRPMDAASTRVRAPEVNSELSQFPEHIRSGELDAGIC